MSHEQHSINMAIPQKSKEKKNDLTSSSKKKLKEKVKKSYSEQNSKKATSDADRAN